MLLVQKYLENKTFGDLALEHGVYASFSKSGHKCSINYDQIEARESDPLSQECRGLILSAEDGKSFLSEAAMVNGKLSYDKICPGKTKVLAFSFRRFFNYGQGVCADINWNDPNLSITTKMDGTLIICYYDPFIKQWCVATRSVPEADLLMDNGLFTFRSLFEKALLETSGLSFQDFTNHLDKNNTYCFELHTPYNRIVVDYKSNGITLLSARSLLDYKELSIDNLLNCNITVVSRHAYTSTSNLIDWVATLNPVEQEGVVVCDSNFNRIKIKSAAYCALNRCRDTLAASERNCLEIILQEKDDDVISFLPEEIANNLLKIKSNLQKAFIKYDTYYVSLFNECNQINPGDKKYFAIALNNMNNLLVNKLWTAYFFKRYDNKCDSFKDFIQKNKKDGSWGSGFLDNILDICNNVSD